LIALANHDPNRPVDSRPKKVWYWGGINNKKKGGRRGILNL
jgi:hypothetical protein